jgi:hypothetical protein
MWIGPDENLNVGDKGFLIKISNPVSHYERYELRNTPPYTNQSHQPVLEGWCGSYNDTSTYGKGMWVVERMAKNGRAFIRKLEDEELFNALEEYGYPDLD